MVKTILMRLGGICYRKNTGKLQMNPQINKLDLRTIPSPFRFQEDILHLSKRIAYIETSRGCPFNCQFCLSSIEVGVRYFDREYIKGRNPLFNEEWRQNL